MALVGSARYGSREVAETRREMMKAARGGDLAAAQRVADLTNLSMQDQSEAAKLSVSDLLQHELPAFRWGVKEQADGAMSLTVRQVGEMG